MTGVEMAYAKKKQVFSYQKWWNYVKLQHVELLNIDLNIVNLC